jgi:preprotein translocase subunit YajC
VLGSPLLMQFLAVLIVALTAFVVLIRPQLKRMADHRLFLNALAVGDLVVTQGGLVGRIEALDHPELVSVSIAANTTVKITRNCIEHKFAGDS